MGGRGSFARTKGNNQNEQFISVGRLGDFPILETNGNTNQHGLPFESHLSRGYLKFTHDEPKVFKELRLYSPDHKVRIEIAYHREKHLSQDPKENVLHYHVYEYHGNEISRSKAIKMHKDMCMYKKYKKYFVGVPEL